MSLGENTGYELLLCLGRGDVVTVTKGGGGLEGRKSGSQSRKNRRDDSLTNK